jgi:hypothetical protein
MYKYNYTMPHDECSLERIKPLMLTAIEELRYLVNQLAAAEERAVYWETKYAEFKHLHKSTSE